MSHSASITELRSMTAEDLRKEIRAHQTQLQKMRLQITMNTEKNTGKYRQDKKQLARMMTVLTEKTPRYAPRSARSYSGQAPGKEGKEGAKDVLKEKPKAAKISAPKKPKKASKVS